MKTAIAELIRGFNSKDNTGCYYCGSYFNFSKESDDVETLAEEIISLMLGVDNGR